MDFGRVARGNEPQVDSSTVIVDHIKLAEYVAQAYEEDDNGGYKLKNINDLPDDMPTAMFGLATVLDGWDVPELEDEGWDVSGLIHDTLIIELHNFELTHDQDYNEEQLEDLSYLFGVGAGDGVRYEFSDFGELVSATSLEHARNMLDSLMEVQIEGVHSPEASMETSGDANNRGLSGNYRTAAVHKAEEIAQDEREAKEKLVALLNYMKNVQGVDIGRDYDLE